MKHARFSNLHYSLTHIYINSITKTKEYNINLSKVMMEFEAFSLFLAYLIHSYSPISTIIYTPNNRAIISLTDCQSLVFARSSGITDTVAM